MKSTAGLMVLLASLAVLSSCGPSAETSRTSETKERVYQRGHRLYETMDLRRAEVELKRAAAMDSSYMDPLIDLAGVYYDLGAMEAGEKNPRRLENFRLSRNYFIQLEELGHRDAVVYERLCELSVALDDDRGFLKYAKKNVEKYPFDRQYFNLGRALFGVEDWQAVVKTQKQAAEKFTESQYIGAYYRQMARAYMKMDRDQTAERILTTGLQAVDACIVGLKKYADDDRSRGEYRRLTDDKIGMLLLLKKLYMTYKAADKIEGVDRQLKEAGHSE